MHAAIGTNEHCACAEDGHCQRYKRDMHGRLREICRGENVDPGDAADYRAAWLAQAGGAPLASHADCPHRGEPVQDAASANVKRPCGPCGGALRQVFACSHPALAPHDTTVAECASCEYRPRPAAEGRRDIVLKNTMSPGDVLVMTAAIRSLHMAHPGKFRVKLSADTPAQELFEHSPDVEAFEGGDEITVHYPAIHKSDERGIHFMQGYCEFLEDVLKVRVPLLTNRPHVWLSKQERSWMDQVCEVTGKRQPYVVFVGGTKKDFTAKQWPHYQRLVDLMLGRILFVQVGEAAHLHQPIRGALNLIGQTDCRQLCRLVYHCHAVVCPTTFLMHLAAAFQKPAVVVAGGREPRTWNQYPKSHVLSTIGAIDCCRDRACWRSRTVKLGDGAEQDASLCEQPVPTDPPSPRCMAMVSPEQVAEFLRFYT